VLPVVVAACNAETFRMLFFCGFVGHAGNKIDEVWQQIPWRGVVGMVQNFAGS